MLPYSTLTDSLKSHSASSAGIHYLESAKDEHFVSYADLYKRAKGILFHLQSGGIKPDNELIILVDRNDQFIDAFWAALLGKIIPAPLAIGINYQHREKIFEVFEGLNNPYLYTDQANFLRLEKHALQTGKEGTFDLIRRKTILVDHITDISKPGREHSARPEDIALIQFSSGSTSEPKGIILTHKNIMSNISAMLDRMKFENEDKTLSWMPLSHDMGLIGFHLTLVVRDLHHYLMPTGLFIRRPSLWLKMASEKGITVLSSPNFGYRHYLNAISGKQKQDLNLSKIRVLFNGAEPISVSLCEAFLKEMAPAGLKHSAMFPVYGLAEASLAVTFPQVETDFQSIYLDREFLSIGDQVRFVDQEHSAALGLVCVGTPLNGCQLRITDKKGLPLPECEIGQIEIRGDNVTSGYYNSVKLTQTTISEDGWLKTGDLGFVRKGTLIVTGRIKEIMFLNGRNYYPHDLEQILENVDSVGVGKVAVSAVRVPEADTDKIAVFVVFRNTLRLFLPVVRTVKENLNEKVGIPVDFVLPVDQIPKTTSGKVQRYLLAGAFERGEFEEKVQQIRALQSKNELIDTPVSGLEKALMSICNEVIEGKTIEVNDNFFDIGADSLSLAMIHERIEEKWPGMLDVTDFFEYPTISELAAFLSGKIEVGST